jgi:RimJ/RimL family protein N-acetyltransferase
MLKPRLPVQTVRLTLRTADADDVDAIHAYRSRADVCRYLPFEPMSREQIAERVQTDWQRTELAEPQQALTLVVVESASASASVIGDIMLRWHSAEDQHAEIGYVFNPTVAGRGFATEAARELLRMGFEEFGLHRMSAQLDARNDPSARLLQRLGMRAEALFRKESIFKGEWSDRAIYAMLAEEWQAQQGRSA